MNDQNDFGPWGLPPAPGEPPPSLGAPQPQHQPSSPTHSPPKQAGFRDQSQDRPVVDITNVINFEDEEDPEYIYGSGYDYPIVGYYGSQPVFVGGGHGHGHRGGHRFHGGGRGGHHGGGRHGGGGGRGGGRHGGHHGIGEMPGVSSAPTGSHMLGFALVAVVAGAGAGWKWGGGPWGALAGALYGGAAVNVVAAGRDALRGDPASDSEAVARGTFAVVGAGAATYILYKTHKSSDEET